MIKVLVVDDSSSFRLSLGHLLESDPEIVVVGWAGSGKQAVDAVMRLRPDVVTMDVMMPDMDGITATQHILAAVGVPIIILTASSGADVGVRALGAGAVDVVRKATHSGDIHRMRTELIRSVKLLSEVKVIRRRVAGPDGRSLASAAGPAVAPHPEPGKAPRGVVAIGASTGGPAIIHTILSAFPEDMPWPVLIAQHIAEGFEPYLVGWWQEVTPLKVRVSGPGNELKAGTVEVASAERHLVVREDFCTGAKPRVEGDHFVPSIDHLFESVAQHCASAAVGVVLSGMGDDGARGLLSMRLAGAVTAVQEPSSSVVDGMPTSALERGATLQRLAPEEIGPWICRQVGVLPRRSRTRRDG